MNKHFALVLVLVFILSLIGCNNTKDNELQNHTDTNSIITVKKVDSIIDNSTGLEFPNVEETFYEDDSHIYIFGNPISEYVIVKYADETTQNVKEALENGYIKISDLDNYGINYFAEPKLIENIVNIAERDGLPTLCELETFYQDEKYSYIFGALISQYIIVQYKDGTEQNVKDALAEGKIKITDLDWFGISYYKAPIE